MCGTCQTLHSQDLSLGFWAEQLVAQPHSQGISPPWRRRARNVRISVQILQDELKEKICFCDNHLKTLKTGWQ